VSTSGCDRIDFVDFGRGLSILSIVLFHYLDRSIVGGVSRAFVFGAAGVHLFMLLSGFGLMLSRFSASPGVFYRRRLVKILVPYYLFVTLAFIINTIHTYYPGAGLYAYLGHLFWFKMFDARIIGSFGGQLWFLSTIIACYLVFPLLRWLMQRLGATRFVLAACVISAGYTITITALGVTGSHAVRRFILQYLWEFCAGMALGAAYKRSGFLVWDRPAWVLGPAAVAGFAGMALVARIAPGLTYVFDAAPSLVGFTAALALLHAACERFALRLHAAGVFLGDISFELFLVHMLVKAMLRPFLPQGTGLVGATVWVLVAVTTSIGVAVLFKRLARPVVATVEKALLPRYA